MNLTTHLSNVMTKQEAAQQAIVALQITDTARGWIVAAYGVAVVGLVAFNYMTRKVGAAIGSLLVGVILGIFVFSSGALEQASKKVCQDSRTDLGIEESSCGGGIQSPVTVP